LVGTFFSLVRMICKVSLSPQYFIYHNPSSPAVFNSTSLAHQLYLIYDNIKS
jgi:hypothetical protein